MYETVLETDANAVVAAPTGCGKTGVLELCVVRLLHERFASPQSAGPSTRGRRKTVYLAPLRALVGEKEREWSRSFGNALGLVCKELTGDTAEAVSWGELEGVDIILATPEKFDAITRFHKDRGGMSFFADVGLLLIDEVHTIDEDRGPVLEAVVSRLRTISRLPELAGTPLASLRIVACSATIPNAADVGAWLGAPRHAVRVFGNELRPVPLQTKVLGYSAAKNDYMFERRLDEHVFSAVVSNYNRRPALVFVTSRKGASDCAAKLVAQAGTPGGSRQHPFVFSPEQLGRLQAASGRAKNRALQQVMLCGVGFHSAALEQEDRMLVEDTFRNRDITVVCATTTLAVGVNLPAHLVVIKGTRMYDDGEYHEMSRSSILQMMGRAGRPQYDSVGVAVIMTARDAVPEYQDVAAANKPLESQLHKSLAEHLNAEIAAGTIKSAATAAEWIESTFLFRRMLVSPKAYGVPVSSGPNSQERVRAHVRKLVEDTVAQLTECGMCTLGDGGVLQPEQGGTLMARHMLKFGTMQKIVTMPTHAGMADLLNVVSRSDELATIRLRRAEKKFLKELNAHAGEPGRLLYPVNEQNGKRAKIIRTSNEKLFLLIQEKLADTPTNPEGFDAGLRQDTDQAIRSGEHVVACIAGYASATRRLAASANALVLAKALRTRLWESTGCAVRQLDGVGDKTALLLVDGGLRTLDDVAAADPRRLESICKRAFPFGSQLQRQVQALPTASLGLAEVGASASHVDVELRLERLSDGVAGGTTRAVLLLGTKHNDGLLFYEHVVLEKFASPYVRQCHVQLPRKTGAPILDVVGALILEGVVGRDQTKLLRVETARFHGRDDDGGVPPQTPHKQPRLAASASASPQEARETCLDFLRRKSLTVGPSLLGGGSAKSRRRKGAPDREPELVAPSAPAASPPQPGLEVGVDLNQLLAGLV